MPKQPPPPPRRHLALTAGPAFARPRRAASLCLPVLLAAGQVLAQTTAPTAQAAPPAPAPAASAASAAAGTAPAAPTTPVAADAAASAPAPTPPAPPQAAPAGQRIEITGRGNDTDERRRATAAKIVIGREEIDKFGDANIGEVLRRLPGVSTPGRPGRGGPPRMRGLGGGFTQLLLDGQRVPPGFSLESLTPEQVERIEILRAPTAETGARAIAGTINIITREGFKKRLNDLRIGLGSEDGQLSNGLFWTHNDSAGPLTYNISSGVFRRNSRDRSQGQTTETDLADSSLVGLQDSSGITDSTRRGLNLAVRLQWRLGEAGDSLQLNPSVFHSEAESRGSDSLRQTLPGPPALPVYDERSSTSDSAFTNARLNLQWRQRLSPATRMELNGNLGQWRARSDTQRDEFRTGQTTPLRQIDDTSRTSQRTVSATLKLSSLLGGKPEEPGSEHSLVSGLELERETRDETRTTLQDGQPLLTDFGDNLQASTQRVAAYVQDELSLNPNWAVHGGLRWEGINTRGDNADGTRPTNRTSVWTPLAHLLWKPDPTKRDQMRLSLTRSYRSPGTGALIARPSINSRYPVDGPNEATSPDSVGNPALQPELASGLDLAFERYLEGGGVLSANLFARRINGLIRSVVSLQDVAYSPVPRWVSQQQNIGRADTQGIELEAKYRLDQLVAGAPGVELRHNLSVYRSKVEGIPGPDNRLDEQAGYSANIGADYRLRGIPLTVGGNLNLVPEVRTQLAEDRVTLTTRKQVFDLFALWTFNPQVGLRVLANNLAPRDYGSTNQIDFERDGRSIRETAQSFGPSFTNWQLRLELKL
jgi:outer membrane receptor for ferrienterochelin and colicins